MTTLKKANDILEVRSPDLDKGIEALRTDIEDRKTYLGHMEAEIKGVKKTIATLEACIAALKR